MTDTPKSKVVSLCGRPMTAEEVTEPPAVREAREAKAQLAHWGPQAARYVGLFMLDDGRITFASSSESPADVLALAALLWRMSQDNSMDALTGQGPVYEDTDDEGPQ